MPSAATAAESIQLALLQAIDDHDRIGFNLLEQLAVAQLGPEATLEILCSLPTAVPTDQVRTALQFLHGGHWIDRARDVIHAAAAQLVHAGAHLGEDISFDALFTGEPRLLITTSLHQAITAENPGAFNLINSFLVILPD
jgi:hypothetical protein